MSKFITCVQTGASTVSLVVSFCPQTAATLPTNTCALPHLRNVRTVVNAYDTFASYRLISDSPDPNMIDMDRQ
jgi:hypothetical protein